jgi:single-strand DNA-binding protein
MASVNKVILLGNCGRDPELRYMPDGKAATSISIATSTKRKNRETGEVTEDTQWHRVQFFDRLAEIVGEYVKKGSPVYIEGRLKYGKYTDRESGQEKNTCDIVATELQLLGARDQQDGQHQAPAQPRQQQPQAQGGYRSSAPRQAPQNPVPRTPAPAPGGGSGFDDMDSDIPF